jgi:cytochrome c oxidase cbb3-type subunit III
MRRRLGRVGKAVGLGLTAVALFAGISWYVTESASTRALLRTDPDRIPQIARLMRFGTSHGRAVYRVSCGSCHGPEGEGDPSLGVPNLRDQDWLYADGSPAEIERTIAYGIRSGHPKARNLTAMPAYARATPLLGQDLPSLTASQINDLAEYLLSLSGRQADVAASDRGKKLFKITAGCFDCHAEDARGDAAIGAPNLTDRIWLYGDGSRAAIVDSISYGHQGVCPAQVNRLSAAEIREVALYVYSLSHSTRFKRNVD